MYIIYIFPWRAGKAALRVSRRAWKPSTDGPSEIIYDAGKLASASAIDNRLPPKSFLLRWKLQKT